MKLIKQLFTLAAIALLITSCNKTDEFATEQNSTFPADGVIRVATSVANPQTRAGMTPDKLYEFQMRIINEENSDYSYYAAMRKINDRWESFVAEPPFDDSNPLTLLWQNKSQKVKVAAIYDIAVEPYPEIWTSGYNILVSNNQSYDNAIEEADILHMKQVEIDPSKDLVDEKIQIDFNHRLSKLNLTVKMGTEFNKLVDGTVTNLITDITVGGTYRSALWKIIEDNLSDYSMLEDIIPWHNATAYEAGAGDINQAQASYECILIPQTVAANGFEVSFKIGTRDFSWRSPTAVTLDADTQYNLTLNVGKDVVTVAGFSATPWTEADPQDLGTE